MAFIRFVVGDVDADSGRRLGVFNAVADLRDRGELSPVELNDFTEIVRWFGANLPKPTRFTRKRNDSHRRARALSWFKDTAQEHIRRMRELVALLQERGVPVHTIVSDRPGYIVYEDEHQVVAEPFADSGA